MILIKTKKKRVFFLGLNLELLRKVFVDFLLLKPLSAYWYRGLSYPRRIIFFKKGKKLF